MRFRAAQVAYAVLLSIGGLYTGAGLLLRWLFRNEVQRDG